MAYQPNKAIHPGTTIQRALDSLGMSQKRLAERTGLSEKHVSQIVNGEASITADTAFLLENAIGGTASFWLSLYSNYRSTLTRLDQEKKAKQEVSLLTQFPYTELVKRNRVPKTTINIEKVISLWKFFGVNSLRHIPHTEEAAYRKGYTDDSKNGHLAAWLRCGEQDFQDKYELDLVDYDQTGLRNSLTQIRSLSQEMNVGFFEEIQKILASVGVGLVAVQYFPGTKASGATRWIGDNPLIQISTYGRDADKMWFTLFHEIGHIIKHGKREQFISFTSKSKSPPEMEADAFAAEVLIPEADYRRFVGTHRESLTEQSIIKFANEQRVHPGIVVGRLKNDELLSYGSYQHLHAKLEIGKKYDETS